MEHILVDLRTGALSGIIDFGDLFVGDPAVDFCVPLGGDFETLGIGNQVGELIAAYGGKETAASMERRVRIMRLRWPLFDTVCGLDNNDDGLVENAIRRLSTSIPRGWRC